jgi:hypothetical protein
MISKEINYVKMKPATLCLDNCIEELARLYPSQAERYKNSFKRPSHEKRAPPQLTQEAA